MRLRQISWVLVWFTLTGLSFKVKGLKNKDLYPEINKTALGAVADSNIFKIQGITVELKPEFGFNAVDRISKDTLAIAVCGAYAYYPFGKIKDSHKIGQSLLKNFKVNNKIDMSDGTKTVVQSLKLKSSKLLLFFNKDPETADSYIIKGEIYDPEVQFIDGIRIGMGKADFFKAFFKSFSGKLQQKFNVICMESCVDAIRHIYTFKNDKLMSVKFECVECSWKIDY